MSLLPVMYREFGADAACVEEMAASSALPGALLQVVHAAVLVCARREPAV